MRDEEAHICELIGPSQSKKCDNPCDPRHVYRQITHYIRRKPPPEQVQEANVHGIKIDEHIILII